MLVYSLRLFESTQRYDAVAPAISYLLGGLAL